MFSTKIRWIEIVVMIFLLPPYLFSNFREDSHHDVELLEKLKRGKIFAQITQLSNSNTYKCRAMGVVYAPQKKVWKVLSDYSHFKDFMPNIAESFIVHPDALEALGEIKNSHINDWLEFEKELMKFRQEQLKSETFYFYNRFNLPWPLEDRYYILKMIRNPEKYSFLWTLFVGNTKVNDGSWELKEYKGNKRKTLAIYTLYTDPGISVSSSLMRIAMKIALPGTIKTVRKRVLSLILEERKNARAKSVDNF